MIQTTTPGVAGRSITEYLGVVTGEAILGANSVRDLFASPDVAASDAGGDFAAEAFRLGSAVAEIHLALTETFPTGDIAAGDLADAMADRLDKAAVVAPDLLAPVRSDRWEMGGTDSRAHRFLLRSAGLSPP